MSFPAVPLLALLSVRNTAHLQRSSSPFFLSTRSRLRGLRSARSTGWDCPLVENQGYNQVAQGNLAVVEMQKQVSISYRTCIHCSVLFTSRMRSAHYTQHSGREVPCSKDAARLPFGPAHLQSWPCGTSLRPDFDGRRLYVSPSDRPACSPPTSSHTRDTKHITLHVIFVLLTHCYCCMTTCITQKQLAFAGLPHTFGSVLGKGGELTFGTP